MHTELHSGLHYNRTSDEREIAFVEMKNQCNTLRRCTQDTKYTQKPKQYGNVDWVPDPFSMETLTFNVGGRRFETYASTLDRDCNCLLSSKTFLQSHYRKDTGEYFFDRDPDVFKVRTSLTLFMLIVFPIHIDAISMGLSIFVLLYLKGSKVENS